MAELPFLDSLQHYTIPNSTRKWTSRINGHITPGLGRDGGPAISDPTAFGKTFLAEYPSLTMGAAFNFSGFFGTLFQANNARYQQGTAPAAQASLHHLGDGRLLVGLTYAADQLVRGFVANFGVWYFIEVNFTLTSFLTGGQYKAILDWEVHIDNAFIDSGTITTTGGGTLPDSSQATFASMTWNCQQSLSCDFYSTTGEFFGDTACRAYFPRVDGTYTAGVPSTGGSHFPMVNEHDPDDAATTIDLQNVNDRDSYLMDTINFYIGVKAAQFLWCARKTEPGLSSFKGTLTSGASDVLTQEYFPNFSFFLYFISGYRLSPHTGVDWTVPELNAQEVGEKRIT